MYLFVLIPFKLNGTIGLIRNKFFGIDKIIFGIVIGSVVFLIGVWADKKARKMHHGKQFFVYQKVVFPVAALVISSLIFYFVTKG